MSDNEVLRRIADAFRLLADMLTAETGDTGEPVVAPPPASEEQPTPVEKPAAPAMTLEQVRSILAGLTHEGHTKEVRELLRRHGADKLSAVDPADYAALAAEAEEIGHAAP